MKESRKTVLRLYEEVWNQKKLDVLPELFADSFKIHYAGQVMTEEISGVRELILAWLSAFPDIRHQVGDIIEQGDKLALRFKGEGTHEGVFMSIEPTHKKFSYTGMNFIQFEKGKIKELWLNSDMYELILTLTGAG